MGHYDIAGALNKSLIGASNFGVDFMLRRLTRLQRLTLVLFVIVVTNWVTVSTTGYSLMGGDLLTFFLVIFLGLSSVALAGTVMRKVRCRVRKL